jgi:hypothetical protein
MKIIFSSVRVQSLGRGGPVRTRRTSGSRVLSAAARGCRTPRCSRTAPCVSLPGRQRAAAEQVFLERGVEALADGVVVKVAPRHRFARFLACRQRCPKAKRGVLRAIDFGLLTQTLSDSAATLRSRAISAIGRSLRRTAQRKRGTPRRSVEVRRRKHGVIVSYELHR